MEVILDLEETGGQGGEGLTEGDLPALEQLIKDLQGELELENLHTTEVVEVVLLQRVLIVVQVTEVLEVLD